MKILTLDYSPSWIWVRDARLFMDSDWDKADMPAIYDMKAGAYVEDEVFAEFVNDNYDRRTYNGTYYGSMHLLPGQVGECSLEEALNEIEKKVSIYMAE